MDGDEEKRVEELEKLLTSHEELDPLLAHTPFSIEEIADAVPMDAEELELWRSGGKPFSVQDSWKILIATFSLLSDACEKTHPELFDHLWARLGPLDARLE